ADSLVLVRSGADGHTGEYAMFPFIDEVRRFFDGPIVVGGGISSGAAVRAVEVLGAEFAYLGTRFLATEESMINNDYRQMVWDSSMEDLIASRAITGALGNWMRASVEAAGLSLESMQATAKIDFSDDMHAGSKAWKHVWSAGQGVGRVSQRESVSQVVAELVSGYREAG
ncbi:MAG: NAD(P)H-dependent flavin oxidoreductase, partial [Granulosicoccus sp.]